MRTPQSVKSVTAAEKRFLSTLKYDRFLMIVAASCEETGDEVALCVFTRQVHTQRWLSTYDAWTNIYTHTGKLQNTYLYANILSLQRAVKCTPARCNSGRWEMTLLVTLTAIWRQNTCEGFYEVRWQSLSADKLLSASDVGTVKTALSTVAHFLPMDRFCQMSTGKLILYDICKLIDPN